MTLFKTYSKLKMAKIFGVSRSTIYDWELRGCPAHPPERPGRPSKMVFEEVLNWRLGHLDAMGYSEEALELTEKIVRGRKGEIYGS